MSKVKEALLAREEDKEFEQLTIFDFIDEEGDEEELDDWEAFKREEELSEQNDEDDDDDEYELTQEDLDHIEYLCEKED